MSNRRETSCARPFLPKTVFHAATKVIKCYISGYLKNDDSVDNHIRLIYYFFVFIEILVLYINSSKENNNL